MNRDTGRALVTGGAGFVGRHVCKRLLDEGLEVDCVDSLSPLGGGLPPEKWPLFDPQRYKTFRFLEKDCRAHFAASKDRYDIVVHLAAMVGGRKLIENAPLVIANNLAFDAAMWNWAATTRPGLVIYASSSAAYPTRLQTRECHVPLAEDMCNPLDPDGLPDATYGWSKLTGEFLMHNYREMTGCPAFAVRPFSGYGEDQSPDYPFPSICRRALINAGSDKLTVWGTGLQQRDFVHIEDCVEVMWQCSLDLPPGGVINISSGQATDFLSLAALAAEAVGYSPKVEGMPGMPEGVFSRVGDRSLQNMLGLLPRISLPEGIRRGVEFQKRLLGEAVGTPV